MSDELKPCPFCGGDAETDGQQGYRNYSTGDMETAVAVYCLECNANMSICRGDVPDVRMEEVVTPWNTRPREAELERQLAECQRERDAFNVQALRLAEALQCEYLPALTPGLWTAWSQLREAAEWRRELHLAPVQDWGRKLTPVGFRCLLEIISSSHDQLNEALSSLEAVEKGAAAEALLNPAIDGDGVDHSRVNHPWAKEGVS